MVRKRATEPQGGDWPPDRALRVLRQQLANLQKLKGRNHREAENDEELWQQITEGTMIHGFGADSHNAKHFYFARSAGIHNMMGISEQQQQLNFQERINKFEANVAGSIAELEGMIPEAALQAAYDVGDEFAFYRDLKDKVATAIKDIFIVDNYLSTEFFELYVEPVRAGVPLRILTDAVKGNLVAVANKYATRGSFELRSSPDVHDRHVFVDGRGWVIGQSIKDAAKKKPTYMVEISAWLLPTLQNIYEGIWARGTVVVNG